MGRVKSDLTGQGYFGYFWVFKEYPQKSQIWKSETSPSLGTWLGIPWLGLASLCQIWDFYGYSLNNQKYPKMETRYFFLWWFPPQGVKRQVLKLRQGLYYSKRILCTLTLASVLATLWVFCGSPPLRLQGPFNIGTCQTYSLRENHKITRSNSSCSFKKVCIS